MSMIMDTNNSKSQGIQSIDIGFAILECLKNQDLSVTEISKQMNMSKSRIHKYLTSFTRLGVLVQNKNDSTYSMGVKLIELGQYALKRYDIISIAEPFLAELSNQLDQSIYMAVWSEEGPVVVKHVEGKNPINIKMREGVPYPLLMSAVGKCFAAFIPSIQSKPLFQDEIIKYKLDEEAIEEDLDKIRQEQVSFRKTTYSEVPGSEAIAAPIFDYNNSIAAVICIVGFAGEFDHNMDSKHVRMLKEYAKQISNQ